MTCCLCLCNFSRQPGINFLPPRCILSRYLSPVALGHGSMAPANQRAVLPSRQLFLRASFDSLIVSPMTVLRALVDVVMCVLSCDRLPVSTMLCKMQMISHERHYNYANVSGRQWRLEEYSLLPSYCGKGLDFCRFLDVGLDLWLPGHYHLSGSLFSQTCTVENCNVDKGASSISDHPEYIKSQLKLIE